MRPWLDCLAAGLPGLSLFDAHTHTGSNDPDGFGTTAEELVASLRRERARAVVFTAMEPEGYRVANARVIAEAASSEGTLVPFCRLDPHDDPIGEAERCLAAGARGFKLHPRAERFELDLESIDPLFALAGERRLPVLIHAGRGIPALGRHVVELCERHPGARAILAHAGICDLGWIWREARSLPNLFFDTSWWSAADLLSLFALVPPGQILLASDAPYGTPVLGAIQTLRCALEAGLTAEQVHCVMGGQIERLIAAEEPLDTGPPAGHAGIASGLLLDRVYTYLTGAVVMMLHGDVAEEPLALARLSCEVGDEAPEAPVCRSILALVARAEAFTRDRSRISHMPAGVHLVVLAATVARTPSVGLPSDVEPVSVSERTA
jgi:predicted TIM-barrel fold metal-dependent hydrolase